MRVTVVAVGKLKERFWREASEEYLTRLAPYASVQVREIADRDPGKGLERALADESADVLRALPESSHVITLEIGGKQLSSEAFAQRLEQLALEGRSSIALVIGGSHGLGAQVLARSNERLSLGPMTLPHNLARVVLLEQLYRAFKIRRGEPYHK